MDNKSLEINTTEMASFCSIYSEIINTLEQGFGSIVSDFKPLLDSGVLSTYIPDLKDNIDKVIMSAKEINSYITKFIEEQEKIENSTSYNKTSYSSNKSSKSKKELSNEEINSLFKSDSFKNTLFSIVTEYPNILSDASMQDLLKELLLKDNNLDEGVISILNDYDGEIIQTTLQKVVIGEINIEGSIEFIENVRETVSTQNPVKGTLVTDKEESNKA